jgi:hypothetical protein
VDLRVGLDDVDKRKFLNLPGLGVRPLSCPARSQPLYLLSYRGSVDSCILFFSIDVHKRNLIYAYIQRNRYRTLVPYDF